MPKSIISSVQPRPLGDELKGHYSFVNDRFDGDDANVWAASAAQRLKSQLGGCRTGVHEASFVVWEKGKSRDKPYFKVYLVHPEDPLLYAWWMPTAATWDDPVDATLCTWFEFVDAKDTKK